jgi:hypothetical protein
MRMFDLYRWLERQRREAHVRKALLILGLLAALAVPAGATAKEAPPGVICGTACDGGGGGWSGCTSQSAAHAAGLPYFSSVKHYLVVSYCKRYGTITSISISAHGCDTSGFAFCSAGPAWQTGGGVGYGYATFEAHANWGVTLAPLYNNTDTLTLTVPVG